MSTAIITGASRGLGLALARALAQRGWTLTIDARGEPELELAAAELSELTDVTAVAGDVSDPWHREVLLARAGTSIDLLVNNASLLKGPSSDPRAPQPELARYPISDLRRVLSVNVLAPLALIQEALPSMPDGAAVINISSDAAVEPYEGWGGYGASKAALDQLSAILAAEQPRLRVYAVDPGDMRTRMHQEAFPGEDISDRPPPEESVPGLLALIEGTRPSGRYRARELEPAAGSGTVGA
jgi:NAD(P)-dependent dehydrogenase (short-subunit alcohol dehydrogenase family)